MTRDPETTRTVQTLAKPRQNATVRAAVAPSHRFVANCRRCMRAMCAGHWSMAFTQLTNATKTLFTLFVNPKAGANRKN